MRVQHNRERFGISEQLATPSAPSGTLRADVRHPSGFDSWQDLRGYLLDYNIIRYDDETCRLIEEAYNHWPNVPVRRAAPASPPVAGSHED